MSTPQPQSTTSRFTDLFRQHRWFFLVLITIACVFYWTQIRPAAITKECAQIATEKVVEMKSNDTIDTYELLYRACARKRGLHL